MNTGRTGAAGRRLWIVAMLCATAVGRPSAGLAQTGPAGDVDLPQVIPIFPLQDVVLFPHSSQPLHIFEPRYREMVADALEGDNIIGMVLLQPGYEAEYEGRPPVYAVGCAGVIVSSEELPDGRYNIVLGGLSKFRILSEDQSRSYRLATVEPLPETVDPSDRPILAERRRQLEQALRALAPGAELPPPDLPDEEVIDALSLGLPLAPESRQELLEAEGPIERASRLIGLLRGSFQAATTFGETARW